MRRVSLSTFGRPLFVTLLEFVDDPDPPSRCALFSDGNAGGVSLRSESLSSPPSTLSGGASTST